MLVRFGVILLDWNEIVVRIYDQDNYGKLTTVYHYMKDVTPSKNDFPIAAAICKKFITTLVKKTQPLGITQWRVCSRYLPADKVEEIAKEIGIAIEKLTLQREQELICRGMLTT